MSGPRITPLRVEPDRPGLHRAEAPWWVPVAPLPGSGREERAAS